MANVGVMDGVDVSVGEEVSVGESVGEVVNVSAGGTCMVCGVAVGVGGSDESSGVQETKIQVKQIPMMTRRSMA